MAKEYPRLEPEAPGTWLDGTDLPADEPAFAEPADGRRAAAGRASMSLRISALVAGVALAAALAAGAAGLVTARDALIAAADRAVVADLDLRAAMLERYLASVARDIRTQGANPLLIEAADAFSGAWRALPGDPAETLRKLYVADNPNPAGRKDALDAAPDGSAYSAAHGRYHPYLRTLMQEGGYRDIVLADTRGNLVYTAAKGPDYATRLATGAAATTGLAFAARAALESGTAGHVAFADFRPSAPGNDVPAGFVATPLVDAAGRVYGVLAVRLAAEAVNGAIGGGARADSSGRVFLVGRDGPIRGLDSASEGPLARGLGFDGEAAGRALAGRSGVGGAVGRDGQRLRIAWRPVDFAGARWALLAERPVSGIAAPIPLLPDEMLGIAAAALAALALAGILLGGALARPLRRLGEAMGRLADGDRGIEVPGCRRGDEIGAMARAVAVFKDRLTEAERLRAEQREAERTAQDERRDAEDRAQALRRQAVLEMADSFERSVLGVVHALSAAATEMQACAESMSASADQANRQAVAVAASSEEASASVQTVASATEELTSSIGEIGRQVAHSNAIAQGAVAQAQQTNARVEGLAEAAHRIGEVVDLIGNIAAQTNLLALNATIEAARAGEAGRGFAVVAAEVKTLAGQTGKATGEIAAQIAAMQGATDEAVAAIRNIGGTIGQIGEIATAVASAVEEQGAATREIAASVQQAASGTREVSGNIVDVTRAAGEVQAASAQMLDAANELAQQGEVLRLEVDRFLYSVREG